MTDPAPVVAIHSQQDVRDLVAAAVNEAHACKDTEPDRAARLLVNARRLERRLYAVRPIPYRPAPVEVLIEMPNVTRFAAHYGAGGDQ